jgi:hypothetical protein
VIGVYRVRGPEEYVTGATQFVDGAFINAYSADVEFDR